MNKIWIIHHLYDGEADIKFISFDKNKATNYFNECIKKAGENYWDCIRDDEAIAVGIEHLKLEELEIDKPL